MNTIDKSLQKQLPTNVLLLIVSSLCVVLRFLLESYLAVFWYSTPLYPYGYYIICCLHFFICQFGDILCSLQLSLEGSAYRNIEFNQFQIVNSNSLFIAVVQVQ